jgi:hypothetical protein
MHPPSLHVTHSSMHHIMHMGTDALHMVQHKPTNTSPLNTWLHSMCAHTCCMRTCLCVHDLHSAGLPRHMVLAVGQQCMVSTEAEGPHCLIRPVDDGVRHSLVQVPYADQGVRTTSGQ